MKIKPTQKRIEFERFLLSLGIRDRSPIIYPKNIDERMLEDVHPELEIYFSVRNYKNKKNYLYEYYKKYSKKKTIDLLTKIKYNQKTNIFEVIWTIEGDLKRLTLNDNRAVLFSFIKEIKKRIPIGICTAYPNPNDILMCRPVNNQIIEIAENFITGARHKASLYKRLGFGELDEDFCQYAIYDENMILHPI
jgi:hypothetical protein